MRTRRAFFGEGVHRLGVAIVDDALMSALRQAARHVRAHPAQANHSNLHN
jgi:hypothetical protein